jgi:hypothetical protein
MDRLRPLMLWLKRRGDAIRRVSGALLVVLGSLMALGRLGAASAAAAGLGRALASAAEAAPSAVRLVAASVWALASIAVLALGRARRRKPVSVPRAIAAAVLAAIAVGEAFGLWSTALAVAAWLSFQGA